MQNQNQNNLTSRPQMKDKEGNTLLPRHSHKPLTMEHQGVQFSIKSNGRVLIKGRPIAIDGTDEVEYDEVEIPASVIFKIREKLNETRTTSYVRVVEVSDEDIVKDEA